MKKAEKLKIIRELLSTANEWGHFERGKIVNFIDQAQHKLKKIFGPTSPFLSDIDVFGNGKNSGPIADWKDQIINILKKVEFEIEFGKETAKKKRKSISPKLRSKLQKEIGSICPFEDCASEDVEHFQVHHIDENPSNNEQTNLILICPTCHSKISKGDITQTQVVELKKSLQDRDFDSEIGYGIVEPESFEESLKKFNEKEQLQNYKNALFSDPSFPDNYRREVELFFELARKEFALLEAKAGTVLQIRKDSSFHLEVTHTRTGYTLLFNWFKTQDILESILTIRFSKKEPIAITIVSSIDYKIDLDSSKELAWKQKDRDATPWLPKDLITWYTKYFFNYFSSE